MYSLYSILLFVALVVSAPWWLLEMLRHGKYRAGLSERLGRVPDRLFSQDVANTIWIHAVSVGEVLAISRVIDELKTQLPGWRVVVSTTTDTGQKLARERFGENNVFYFPVDLPFAVRAYLRTLRPKLLVLAESEFWPNLLRWARLSGAAVAVVNARVSDRSLPGYLRFHKLLRRVMQNVQLFLAQSEEDARRLIQMGAPAERVQVSGNLKFEVKPPVRPAIAAAFATMKREEIGPLLVAGSTLEGEEAMLLDMFRQVVDALSQRAIAVWRPGILSVSRPSRHRLRPPASLTRGARNGRKRCQSRQVFSCSTALASWPACMSLPIWRLWAEAWYRGADTMCWKQRNSGPRFWLGLTRKTSATSSSSSARLMLCAWSLRSR